MTHRSRTFLQSALVIVLVGVTHTALAAKPTPRHTATPTRTATPTPVMTPTTTPVPPSAVSVVITEPASGATIDANRVNVRGTFVAPPNSGVSVNGRVAYAHAGRFALNELPLVAGANTIDVVVTTLDGRTATKSISVAAAVSPPPLQLVADATRGFAPSTVTFTYVRASTVAITKFAIDFDGDGRDDFSTRKAPPSSIENTYTIPGLYDAQLTLLTAAGQTLRSSLSILVESEAARDDLFTGLWSSMNDALVKQNVSAALAHLNAIARQRYAPVFSDLLPDMPTIVASYSSPQRVSVTADVLEYAVNRVIDGEDQIFFVYALRDGDGVWRIDSM